MKKILYVHGYNGNPYGKSYNNLKSIINDKYELYTIDYTVEKPFDAIESIKKYVNENNIDCVIGCSLGGFLTMYITGIPRIAVNPCWDPVVELPKIGYNNSTDEYYLLNKNLSLFVDMEEYHLCLGVFSLNDEMLGTKYKNKFNRYFKSVLIDGGHHIDLCMSEVIINNILPCHLAQVDDFCKKLKEADNAQWLE